MSLLPIVRALGGDLNDGGRRANVPAPGHSRRDRSISLLLSGGRVVAHGFGAADWREALDDLRRRGLIDAAGRPRSVSGAPSHLAHAEPRNAADRRATARRLWAEGCALLPSTASALYAARRGVRRELAGVAALRHHCAAPLAVYSSRRAVKPALLAQVCDSEGALTAIELTYLEPSGRRAISLRLPRKTIGVMPPGCAVRLDPPEPEMLVGEGVFTVLSAAERYDLPAWALLSTSNLRRWRPPSGVRRVLIAADRGRDGASSAARLAAELRRGGVSAEVRFPPSPHEDWNDHARAQARGVSDRPTPRWHGARRVTMKLIILARARRLPPPTLQHRS